MAKSKTSAPLRIWHYSPGGEGLEFGLDAVTPVDWQIGKRAPKRAQYVFRIPDNVVASAAFQDWLRDNGPRVVESKNALARMFKEFAARPAKAQTYTTADMPASLKRLGDFVYKGYYVQNLGMHGWGIQKGGQHIAYARDPQHAREEIDLLTPERYHTRGNPKHPRRNPARVGKRARKAAGQLVRRYGKPRARKVAGGMIGRASTPKQREHFVKVRKAINPKARRNPIPMFPVYIRKRPRTEWNLAAVGRTKELANEVARGLVGRGWYVAVTDGERPRG